MQIPFSPPFITREEVKAVSETLKSGWLTMGPKVVEFEEKFAKYIGAPHCVAVSSCTAAMFLVLESLAKKPREVAIPSLTFTATAAVCIQSGIDIDFIDIDPGTFLLKKTKKMSVPVHYGGLFCKQQNVVLEDSAHRIVPKSFSGKPTCFSFYATKNMTTGEGGMIATSSLKQADWLREARLHGLSRDAWKRYGKEKVKMYRVDFPGWKFNLTDPAAAMGLVQLRRLPVLNALRKKLANRYRDNLGGIDREVDHLFVHLVSKRDEFIEYMRANGVNCSIHFVPLHQQPAYKKYYKKLPVTEFVCRNIVSLPLFSKMTSSQVDYVCKLTGQWEKKYGKVTFP